MRLIPLSQGLFARVDDEDYDRVIKAGKWHARKSKNGCVYYAVRNITSNGRQKTQYMHQFIMGYNPSKSSIDHKDGDGLNNQKYNLKPCTHQENMMNRGLNKNSTSGYRGVRWNKLMQKWEAYIGINGKQKYLGYFNGKEDAARAYDVAAIKRNPEFNRLNFPNNICIIQ